MWSSIMAISQVQEKPALLEPLSMPLSVRNVDTAFAVNVRF
jgi:hypothetical protein